MMARRNLASDLDEVLCCPMLPNDANAGTVGEYLLKILRNVWEDGEGFSGKRPFGNSGWEYDIYYSLAEEGLIDATVDDEGEYIKLDKATGHKLVKQAIMAMWSSGK